MTETIIILITFFVALLVIVGGMIYCKRLDREIAEQDRQRAEADERAELERELVEKEKRLTAELMDAVLKRYESMDTEKITEMRETIKLVGAVEKTRANYPQPVYLPVPYYPFMQYRPW